MDSASRLQPPCGAREKNAPAVLAVGKCFVTDMGAPRIFRTDMNGMFVDYCSSLGIASVFTAPRTPRQNGPVESAIFRAFKVGGVHAARLGVPQLFPGARLEETRGCTDAAGTSLWLDSLLWVSECFNRAATSMNEEWLSPHKGLLRKPPAAATDCLKALFGDHYA